ncbi:MAG: type II toxin-antitoxin system RelE/ParE family toxin [Candidatus Heimdallarchaeota archaeon]|nr:MAG: type II toxin-antitoxin system RelE/ParE family toxin [Candidatus Heimdallarchaeota archaeon]
MTYQILLHPKADGALKKLENKTRNLVKKKIRELSNSPEIGERLLGTTFLKLRAGNYRIIYEIETKPDRIIILYIGHRKHVYDEFQRLL